LRLNLWGAIRAAPLFPDPSTSRARAGFILQCGEFTGTFELAIPRSLFQAAGLPQEGSMTEPGQPDFKRNLDLLENARVELDVVLEGPTLAITEILALKAGQVITFDYSLKRTLRGLVNGNPAIMGHIVCAGRKRAFEVEEIL
jgi:flagellar motor switch protein FliM